MKKHITSLFALGLLLSANTILNAQTGRVGVNTSDPKSTMDINGKRDEGGVLLTTDITGLQAPRLTRAELTAKGDTLYGADQKGTLIYITDITAGDAGAGTPRKNINSIGYYYFDGTDWQKFLDTDTTVLPTGFERRPDMSASNFYWRLIGAPTANYGTEGKYGLDATWNPANMNEAFFPGPYSYNQVMGLAGLTLADLGAKGQNSFAAGAINSASGTASTALGTGNTASGVGSFASGVGTKSTGLYTTSMGRGTLANGDAAFAAGLFSEATNNAAVAMGNTSKASGDNSVAIGQANTASAQGTLAIGNTNTASAVSAVGIGQQNAASGQGSMALGNTNITSATSATAIGQTNNVAGNAAVGIGNNNGLTSTANSSVGIGFTNTLTGANTFAFGEINKVNALSSYAIGRNNETLTDGIGSVLVGFDNKSETTRGFAIGSNNTTKGTYSYIYGSENTTNGTRSAIIGNVNSTTGSRSLAIGNNLTTGSAFSTSMGAYNTDETSPEATAYTDMTKRLLVVGNGTSTAAKSDALVMLRNGKTGLSTTPTETLDVGVGNVRVRDINLPASTSTVDTDKFVVADSNGVLKTKNLFIPYTALTGFKTTPTGNLGSAGGLRIITMDSNPLINGMTYNAGQYTVGANSGGYYQIAATLSTDVSMNSPTGGTAVFRLRVNGNAVNTVINGYLDGTSSTSQNMVYVIQLAPGDVIDLQNSYTRTHRVTSAQISAIKLSN